MNKDDKRASPDTKKSIAEYYDEGRKVIVHRQQIIFYGMIVTGIVLMTVGYFHIREQIGNGVAFLLVGFAGLLMSWTTMDIGESLKITGRQNLEMTENLTKAVEKFAAEAAKDRKEAAKERKAIAEAAAEDRKETQRLIKKFTESLDKLIEKS